MTVTKQILKGIKLIARGTILEEAAAIVDGQRQDAYGHPRDNYRVLSAMWAAYLGDKHPHIAITPRDAANMMGLAKYAREAHAPKRDNLVDIAGYARVAEMLGEPEAGASQVQVENEVGGRVAPVSEQQSVAYISGPFGIDNYPC